MEDRIRLEAEKRLLAAIFGEDEEYDGHDYCIYLDTDPENGLWFSQWIKYREDLPGGVKAWLDEAGVKPGESVPMFTGGQAEIMAFKYKGMAEKVAEMIADKYEDFRGKLHVQIYEAAPGELES